MQDADDDDRADDDDDDAVVLAMESIERSGQLLVDRLRITSAFIYRPDALPDAQPTVAEH